MQARVHGFNWEVYADCIMPAFTRWLLHGDAAMIYTLYIQTRCAQEEEFVPPAIQHLRTWQRAQAFVQQLPRGTFSRREFELLCDAHAFTELSDSYIHRYAPQLYQYTDALHTLWGALVERYCQFQLSHLGASALAPNRLAGDTTATAAPGVELGHHPATIHIRGWLATHSVRAMVLFELLACGRRRLPFGSRQSEPYGDYVGYLTPAEVLQLALCLRHVAAPPLAEAEQEQARFRQLQSENSTGFHLVDELLPTHAEALLTILHLASQCGSGLICKIE